MSLVYFIRNWDKLIPEERLYYLHFINNQIISNNKVTNKEDEDFIKLYKILEKNHQVSSSDLLNTLDTYNISPLIYEYFENLVKVK